MLQHCSQPAAGVADNVAHTTANPLAANPVTACSLFPSTVKTPAHTKSSLSANTNNNKPAPASSRSRRHGHATLAPTDDRSSYDKCSVNTSGPTQPTNRASPADRMITQTSLLEIPRTAKYYDLAWFLKHTGPDGIYESPKRAPSVTSKSAFRFFRKGGKPATNASSMNAVSEAHKDLNNILLYDKGGLLEEDAAVQRQALLKDVVEQKQTTTGKPYLAVTVDSNRKFRFEEEAKSGIEKIGLADVKADSALEMPTNPTTSHVSTVSNLSASHEWLLKYDVNREPSPVSPVSPISTHDLSKDTTENAYAPILPPIDTYKMSPIRPPASYSPAPPSRAAPTMAETYQSDLREHPAKSPIDITATMPKRSGDVTRKPVTPMPTLILRGEEFPVNVPRPGRECDMQHPSPRRFASHPVLQRSSTLVEADMSRSRKESVETPPPKSPFRLRRDDRIVERSDEADDQVQKPAQKVVPVITTPDEFSQHRIAIVPTVTTECTGPLTRTSAQMPSHPRSILHNASRKDRESRMRARKMRDRPSSISRTIDSIVGAHPASPRHKLRKAGPHITTPDLKPAPLVTRASPAKVKAGNTVGTPSSHRYSRASSLATADTPASLSITDSPAFGGRTRVSSTLLLAEEIPLSRAKSSIRAARIVVAKERVYTPRPRSASMPQRRSRSSLVLPSRIMTPEMPKDRSETPPLPSPPPNRALPALPSFPPTPPASVSDIMKCKKTTKIPAPVTTPLQTPEWPQPPSSGKSRQHASGAAREPAGDPAQLNARVAYLEKQNKMLNAALMAVLSTNGESNMPLSELLARTIPVDAMTWEDRVTRRSEAGHKASSSNGSALDFYLSTRRGSKAGS